jgi:hypothetical protein
MRRNARLRQDDGLAFVAEQRSQRICHGLVTCSASFRLQRQQRGDSSVTVA